MVALALRTPYEKPVAHRQHGAEPNDTAIRQDAIKNANQVWKSIANTAMKAEGTAS